MFNEKLFLDAGVSNEYHFDLFVDCFGSRVSGMGSSFNYYPEMGIIVHKTKNTDGDQRFYCVADCDNNEGFKKLLSFAKSEGKYIKKYINVDGYCSFLLSDDKYDNKNILAKKLQIFANDLKILIEDEYLKNEKTLSLSFNNDIYGYHHRMELLRDIPKILLFLEEKKHKIRVYFWSRSIPKINKFNLLKKRAKLKEIYEGMNFSLFNDVQTKMCHHLDCRTALHS